MANKKDPYSQFIPNIITEEIKTYDVVPATFSTLIDLGTDYLFTHILIISSLDKDVILKFGSNEITFRANKDVWIDDFTFNGIIEYKYKTDAPTTGDIQIVCH